MSDLSSTYCSFVGSDSYSSTKTTLKHKRRFCKVDGCTRIVKSQGVCQRHGAKPKMCTVTGCKKQAQGNVGHMCKSHFKASVSEDTSTPHTQAIKNQQVKTVYENILMESLSWKPSLSTEPMPLVDYLTVGFVACKPYAWHRNEERQVRGLPLVVNLSQELDHWERDLAFAESLVLAGNSEVSFRYLAHAWGRENGFHTGIATEVFRLRNIDGRRQTIVCPDVAEDLSPLALEKDNLSGLEPVHLEEMCSIRPEVVEQQKSAIADFFGLPSPVACFVHHTSAECSENDEAYSAVVSTSSSISESSRSSGENVEDDDISLASNDWTSVLTSVPFTRCDIELFEDFER